MVEKKKNKVVFAESDKGFIDLLFSFLTLPIGTILRVLVEKPPPNVIGCMDNLYKSVADLDSQLFSTVCCKEMLLQPRRSLEAECSRLKLKIEDHSKPIKGFFLCQNSNCRKELSYFPGVRCRCGQMMNGRATLLEPHGKASGNEGGGVFVKGGAEMFLISDVLQVMEGSTSFGILLLKKQGIVNANDLQSQIVNIGPEEILQLLQLSLVSKKPLTSWILLKAGTAHLTELEPVTIFESLDRRPATNESKTMGLKLFVSKARNKVLYAESRHDFVDFIFSFLTFPLGSILKLLDGKSSLGCADNLYRSVNDLSNDNYLRSEEVKNLLLCPKLPPHFACENQLLHIEENSHPQYIVRSSKESQLEWFVSPVTTDSNSFTFGETLERVSFVNPKSSKGESTYGGGFVKGPAKFMITDDLVVTLLSPIASFSLIGKLNVPIMDIDEMVVEVGEKEALNILKAALISKTALTDVFIRTH